MPEEQYLTEKHYLVCTKGMLPVKVNVSSQDSTTFSGHLAATTEDTLKKKNFVCIGSTAFIAGVGAGVAAALAAAAAVALAALCVPGPGWILAAIIAVAIVGATAYGYHLCKCAAVNRQWTLPSQRTSINKNNALLISSVMQCPDHQGTITPKETLWAAFKSAALINLGHIANFAFGFLVGRGLGVVALEGFAAGSESGALSAMGRSLLQAAKTELRDMYTWKGMWTLLQKRNFFCFGMRGLGIGGSYYNQYNIWTNDDTSLMEKIQASGIGIVCDIFAAKGWTVTCFPAGTKVHAKNGIANIEKLREGDLVLTFNEETKEQEYKPVTKVHAHQTGGLLVLELPGSEFIKVTPDHRFYSNGEWIEVGELQVGDTLQQKNGVYTFICGIEKLPQIVKVYNFDVAGNQNYYVTEDGILVHNGLLCGYTKKELDKLRIKQVRGKLTEAEQAVFDLWKASKYKTIIHHIASNKHATKYTPEFEKIAKKYGLKLDQDWNKIGVSSEFHYSSHPDRYHEFVLDGMKNADAIAGGNVDNKAKFIELFHEYITKPMMDNPNMLNKTGW